MGWVICTQISQYIFLKKLIHQKSEDKEKLISGLIQKRFFFTAKTPRTQSFYRRVFLFKKEFKPLRFPSRAPRLCG